MEEPPSVMSTIVVKIKDKLQIISFISLITYTKVSI